MWIKLLHCEVGGGSVRDRLYLRNLNTIFIALIKFGAFFFKFLGDLQYAYHPVNYHYSLFFLYGNSKNIPL